MITIQEIHAYLNQLTPQDELYKKYYQETGRLLPIDLLPDFWAKNHLIESHPSPLSFLNPAYLNNPGTTIGPSYSADSMLISPKFNVNDSNYFGSYDEISIRKHSNYFPQFCHNHGFMEVCYIMKGQCSHQFYRSFQYKEPSDDIIMHENDLLIIPPGIYHIINTITDSVIVNIMVKPTMIEKIVPRFSTDDVPLFGYFTQIIYQNKIDSFLLFHLGKDEFLDSLFDRLLLEYINREPPYSHIMGQILGLFFSIIQRDHGNDIKFSKTAPTGTDYIPAFLLYLQSHYAHFSMKKMATYFNLSPSYISRIFKARTNSTIIQILTGIRLETAKNLLKNTAILIDDIALYVGYEDTTYFIRLFKKKFTMTPQKYRKHIEQSSLYIKERIL
jgi:AraC-like DNA-binding protein